MLVAIEFALYLVTAAVLAACLYPFVHQGFLGLALLLALPMLVMEHLLLRRKIGRQSDRAFVALLAFLIALVYVGSRIGHWR
jgi:hypothetical protein